MSRTSLSMTRALFMPIELDDAPHCLFKLVSSKSPGSAKRSAPTPIRASDTAAPPPSPPHPATATVAFLRAACLSMRPVFRATSTSYWSVTSDLPGLRLPCLSAWGDDLCGPNTVLVPSEAVHVPVSVRVRVRVRGLGCGRSPRWSAMRRPPSDAIVPRTSTAWSPPNAPGGRIVEEHQLREDRP